MRASTLPERDGTHARVAEQCVMPDQDLVSRSGWFKQIWNRRTMDGVTVKVTESTLWRDKQILQYVVRTWFVDS